MRYKVIDGRQGLGSTEILTNVDFSDWTEYLGDPALVMALLDRVSDAMPWIDYADLRRRLKIVDVLAWMNWEALEGNGDSLRGPCPFCDATKSLTAIKSIKGRIFVVNTVRKLFKCFRCHEGGNVLDLWTRYRKTELNTADNELQKLLIDQPKPKSSNSQSQPTQPQN